MKGGKKSNDVNKRKKEYEETIIAAEKYSQNEMENKRKSLNPTSHIRDNNFTEKKLIIDLCGNTFEKMTIKNPVIEKPEDNYLISVWKNSNIENLHKNKHKDIVGRKDNNNYQLKKNTENEFFYVNEKKEQIDVNKYLNPNQSVLSKLKNPFGPKQGGKRRTKRRTNKKRTNKRKKTKTRMKKRKTHKRKTNKRRRKR